MRGYLFCETCNGITGRWDEEYKRWWVEVARFVLPPAEPGGDGLQLTAKMRPGSIIRCIAAWAFALDPELLRLEPGVAHAIRTGEPHPPPSRSRLLLAVTPSLSGWFVSQRGAFAMDVGGAPEPMPPVVVAAPPFNFVLADPRHEHELPHTDLGPWLQHPATEVLETTISFPVIQIPEPTGPVMVEYAHLQNLIPTSSEDDGTD